MDSEAAELFDRGTKELRAEKPAEAEALFSQAMARVPAYPAIVRRRSQALMAMGRKDEALQEARRAAALTEETENLQWLAMALIQVAAGDAARTQEAMTVARRAVDKTPKDIDAQLVKCTIAMNTSTPRDLVECGQALGQLAPDEPMPLFFAAMSSALSEDLAGAKKNIQRARERGLPPALADEFDGKLAEAEAPLWRYGKKALLVGALWGAGLLLLLGLGKVLSKATLKQASAGADERQSTRLRGVYRGLLVASCLYYFASLPLVLASVVVLGAGLLLAILALGVIPIKLVLIIGLVVVGTVWSVIKGALTRPRDEDPGEKLDLSEHPGLRGLLDEVAAKVATRPVDNVYLTPGTDIAVFERGGMLAQVRGATERCLLLGAGVLDGMKLGPLRAILAHEYGHFSNRDTAGGDLALAVRRSLLTSALGIARAGSAGWFNPMWLFLVFFHRIFTQISQGASRLQETLADRWSATCYGADAFVDGLTHVIRRSVEFDAHTQSTLREVIESKASLTNIYRHTPSQPLPAEQIEKSVAEALDREPDEGESHPAPRDRFAAVRALAATVPPAPDDGDDAWGLFHDRQAIEQRMTSAVRQAVLANHDVVIPESQPSP